MDYVLVAYLAAEQTALSYAVGEWARIWPLQTLIRAMGAYFVRRNSKNPLYRRVLERYVAHGDRRPACRRRSSPRAACRATAALRPPRLGLLDYMLRAFDPAGRATSCFVPVGINYDRVLEDRTLLAQLDRRRAAGALRGRRRLALRRFGMLGAALAAGALAPLRLRLRQLRHARSRCGASSRRGGVDLRGLDPRTRRPRVESSGARADGRDRPASSRRCRSR